MFADKMAEWDERTFSAKACVLKTWEACEHPSMRTGSEHMPDECDEYYEVLKALLSTGQNPYGFLDQGGSFDTWESTESFIHIFHHSCIDDGDHCYLSDELHGPKLVFRDVCDFPAPIDLYYLLYPNTKDLDKRMEEFYERRSLPREKRGFEFHYDYKRFIKELEERPEKERKKAEEFVEKMVRLKEKL